MMTSSLEYLEREKERMERLPTDQLLSKENLERSKSNTGCDIQPPYELFADTFEKMMNDLAFDDDKKSVLRSMPDVAKWTLLVEHKSREKELEKKTDGPIYFATSIRKCNVDDLTRLRVCLSSETVPWVTTFLDCGGLCALRDVIQTVVSGVIDNIDVFID